VAPGLVKEVIEEKKRKAKEIRRKVDIGTRQLDRDVL
jgi:hypothetical protein